jgi:hypothetical protein
MDESGTPMSDVSSTEPGRSRPRSRSMPPPKRRSKSSARNQTQSRKEGSQQKQRAKSLPRRPARTQPSAAFLEDIRHEVMVNYLYQQQCSRLWVSDGTGILEGVVVRKTGDEYLACPRELISSTFAQSMAALGVQVTTPPPT